MVSPPRCWVVAGLRPSSKRVGTAKSPLGPARWVYEVSFESRCMSLISGSGAGWSCPESRGVSPGSGRDSGVGKGFATAPSFSAACCTWVILIVGFFPFASTSLSGSYSVLPILVITSTPASVACFITSSSLSLAYASVSFSNTRCVIFHALNSFTRIVCGASRTTNSFDFLFSLVMEAERSDWQSSL